MNVLLRIAIALAVVGLLIAGALPAVAGASPATLDLRGCITSVAPPRFTLVIPSGSVLILTDESTQFVVPGMETPTLADVHEGDLVHARLTQDAEGRLLARLVAVIATREIRGTIAALESPTIAVDTDQGQVQVLTDERTRYRIPEVAQPTYEDLAVGDRVVIGAVQQSDGTLLARVVAVAPHVVRLDGDVTHIAGNNLKIANPNGEILVHTDEKTKFHVPGVENPTLADIHEGDHIHGLAVEKGNGSLWGRIIAVVDEHKFHGQVAAIDGVNVTVNTLDGLATVATDDRTRFEVPGVENPTLADVKVGDLVFVVAFGQEDGSMLAKLIAVRPKVRFRGEVLAKNGATLTVATDRGNVDVLTDANTRYRVPGVDNPTLDDVHVGDTVAVIAVSQGAGGGLLATGIGVLPPQDTP